MLLTNGVLQLRLPPDYMDLPQKLCDHQLSMADVAPMTPEVLSALVDCDPGIADKVILRCRYHACMFATVDMKSVTALPVEDASTHQPCQHAYQLYRLIVHMYCHYLLTSCRACIQGYIHVPRFWTSTWISSMLTPL